MACYYSFYAVLSVGFVSSALGVYNAGALFSQVLNLKVLLVFVLTPLLALLPDLSIRFIQRNFYKENYHVILDDLERIRADAEKTREG